MKRMKMRKKRTKSRCLINCDLLMDYMLCCIA